MAPKNQKSPVSEYMKIRRHVLNIIYRHAGESVRLPTMVELSKTFKVSGPTVNKALKALSEEGYIIGRRGIGSFTNPNIRPNPCPLGKSAPLIGVALHDGMVARFNAYTARALGVALEEITSLPAEVSQVFLSSKEPETALRQLEREQLDGLVWLAPPVGFKPLFERLVNERFPFVIAHTEMEHPCSSASFDYARAARRCGEILLNEGRRDILCFADTPPRTTQTDALRALYRDAGIQPNERLFFKDTFSLDKKIKELIAGGVKFDAVFGPMMLRHEVEDFLLSLDPEIHKTLAVVNTGLSLPSKNPFYRISYQHPFNELAKTASELLRAQLDGDFEIKQMKIEFTLKIDSPPTSPV